MDLFGVQELPTAKSAIAPGWAYVADTGVNPAVAALQPSRAKRAAGPVTKTNPFETTAKQEAKILRELAALDKESHRDVQIPIPVKHRDGAGRASHGKVTPNVRKILQSQKTFANHLSDAEALAALAASQPQSAAATAAVGTPATPLSRASPASLPATNAKSTHKKGTKRKSEAAAAPAAKATPLRHVASTDTPTSFKRETGTMDVEMTDAPASASATDDILRPLPPTQQLPPHKDDHNPLLISYIPVVPSQAELEALLNAPPLTYHEARGELKEEDLRKPPRRFCEICGYWGRVKCMKCGARVCALECLRTHGEDCYARYGA